MLPALSPVSGALSVSPVVMRTWSMSTPKADAAICASPMLVPAMSTWPVRTWSDPSGLSRTVAPVGWSPGIQPPTASPVPRSPWPFLPPLFAHSARLFQSGCSASRRSTSFAPLLCQGWPLAIGSPSCMRCRSRNSTGSSPSRRAISSMWESMAKMVWGAVGAR